MAEKKHQIKQAPLPELQSSVTEVLVTNGRTLQPFIRTFHYTGENIAKHSLGTLVGVFEIDDQSEDSAYIVNFLASVAKKEFFNNSRRGAIESFEAALHKMNLALAELVKHGNVAWLGKFHGAIGVLEKNNLHFSVSGRATIFLRRNDNVIDLSEDLASDESHIHPLKTFVEVSSGRLRDQDQILFASPELSALFSLEELSKQATRMDRERFAQFLKTALVNELDMAGLMIADLSPSPLRIAAKKPKKSAAQSSEPEVNNVFSQSAFASKKQKASQSVHEVLVTEQQIKEEEYIDTKTGHIYVQGDTPEAQDNHPVIESFKQVLDDCSRQSSLLFVALGKNLRKTNKRLILLVGALTEKSQTLGRRVARAARRRFRQYKDAREERRRLQIEQTPPTPEKVAPATPPITAQTVTDIPQPERAAALSQTPTIEQPPSLPVSPELPSSSRSQTNRDEFPPFLREKLAKFYRHTAPDAPNSDITPRSVPIVVAPSRPRISSLLREKLADAKQALLSGSRRLAQVGSFGTGTARFGINRRIPLLIAGIGLGVMGLWYLFGAPFGSTPVLAPPTDEETFRPQDSGTDSKLSETATTLQNALPQPIVAPVILNDELYIVMEQSILSLSENKTYELPNRSQARFATAMDDLRLLFVYTDNNQLYAFSPISRTFVENTLPFDGTLSVSGIDTYLTYLYVLDSTRDQVYRFPRAEGGFGTSIPWFRESVTIETDSRLTVNETLFIANDAGSIRGFFRGRSAGTFELPDGLRVTDLYTHPGLTNVYALDSEHARIIVWNQDGKLLKEIQSQQLSEGRTLSVNEKQGEIYIGTENSLFSLKLK